MARGKQHLLMKQLLALAACVFFSVPAVWAQFGDSALSRRMTSDYTSKGIEFRESDNFYLNLRFRAQFRAGYFSRLDNEDKPGYEALVRRLRLRFEGFLISPKFEYKLQLAFTSRDMDLESGSPQIVRDAIVYYNPTPLWSFGLGQTKLPGNRERLNSSGELQMPDRSIANSKFTVDRDFGIFIDRDIPVGETWVLLRTAISTGEGRGNLSTDQGLAFTGRVEYLPFGKFTRGGDYFEGDLAFEPTPKLSLGFTYSKNNRATRTGGQLGRYMVSSHIPNEKLQMDMQTIMADGVLKYNGWALLAEYYDRKVYNFSVADFDSRPLDYLQFMRVGEGVAYNFQASRMLSRKDEIAFRFTDVRPHQGVKDYQYRFRTKAIGYSHYINNHKFKIQGYVGLDDRMGNSEFLDDAFRNRLNVMMQIEMGI